MEIGVALGLLRRILCKDALQRGEHGYGDLCLLIEEAVRLSKSGDASGPEHISLDGAASGASVLLSENCPLVHAAIPA